VSFGVPSWMIKVRVEGNKLSLVKGAYPHWFKGASASAFVLLV